MLIRSMLIERVDCSPAEERKAHAQREAKAQPRGTKVGTGKTSCGETQEQDLFEGHWPEVHKTYPQDIA